MSRRSRSRGRLGRDSSGTAAAPPGPSGGSSRAATRRDRSPPADRYHRRRSRSRSRSRGRRRSSYRDRGGDRRRRSRSRERRPRYDRHDRYGRRGDRDYRDERHRGDSRSHGGPPFPSGWDKSSTEWTALMSQLGISLQPNLPNGPMGHGSAVVPSGGDYQLTLITGDSRVDESTKPARRAYVGNLPFNADQDSVREFWERTLHEAVAPNQNLPPGRVVCSVYVNRAKKFAFVEMRSIEECEVALALDGVHMAGFQLRLRRPSEYAPGKFPAPKRVLKLVDRYSGGGGGGGGMGGGEAGGISSQVPDGPNKVFCGGVPYEMTKEQVIEMVSAFGKLKAFHLVYDSQTRQSKGFCFFEYADPNVTDVACAALNNQPIGDKILTVRRAQPHAMVQNGGIAPPPPVPMMHPGMAPGMPGGHMLMGPGGPHPGSGVMPFAGNVNFHAPQPKRAQRDSSLDAFLSEHPTIILIFYNVASEQELQSSTDVEDLRQDIAMEMRWPQVKLYIPNLTGQQGESKQQQPPVGLGHCFIAFQDPRHAAECRRANEGRPFNNAQLQCAFMTEKAFQTQIASQTNL